MIRIKHSLAVAMLLALLAACAARNEPGWQGRDATAFGTADGDCAAQTRDLATAERDLAYRACMARHGWTPGAANPSD